MTQRRTEHAQLVLRAGALLAIFTSAQRANSALAQTGDRACAQEHVYVAPDAIGLEGEFTRVGVTLRRTSGGATEEIPVEVSPSSQTSCTWGLRAFRIRPARPLEAAAQYRLELDPTWNGCAPGSRRAPLVHTFTAPESLRLPDSLRAPEAPEVTAEGCPPQPDYVGYRVARPALDLAAGVFMQLSVDGRRSSCSESSLVPAPCEPGLRYGQSLRWVAGVPHTGLELEGPALELAVDCDSVRHIDTCPATPPKDAAELEDAAEPLDAGTSKTARSRGCALQPLPGAAGSLADLCLLAVVGLASRRRKRP